jgi:hypothetical protein
MADAESANRRAAAFYVYREDIRYTEQLPGGGFRRDTRAAYEVTILEGEPYHRKIEQDGQPLSAMAAAEEEKRYREVERFRRETPTARRRQRYFEAEENRFKIDSRIVLEFHEASLAGEETYDGRPCWVVDTAPRRGAPRPKRRSQWSLSQKLRFWIDKDTGFPIRVVATQLFDFDSARRGTVTEVRSTQMDGVWLLRRIGSEGKRKVDGQTVVYRTVQEYSNYRRFTATTHLLFDQGQ